MSTPASGDRPLTAVALVCSLKPSPTESSSALMAEHICQNLHAAGVETEAVRCVDYAIAPGVEADMGDGDEWPQIREKLLRADILVLSTPIWLGHPASVTQRVLERLDAELSNTDDAGRPIMVGKVAVVGVVGNEDGAHKVIADCFQGLNDIGYTIPAQGGTYWTGEAMQSKDYKDLDEVPEPVTSTTAALARNAVHLARALRDGKYPPYQ
ncbi:flavodoxin [Mycobacterium sp. GA-1285]|uniref:flavodoxin family protein n=1 Tax=Mycobacterium sp. GA-1285 TaxID=1772282 RepID=UPI00074724F8|nr:NAD(P)H-dependent oxidoreductase [Mycobacterium sp. GA-1285]KUI15799.1 flavodoxin [Mycobacterium sp. GA-1285]